MYIVLLNSVAVWGAYGKDRFDNGDPVAVATHLVCDVADVVVATSLDTGAPRVVLARVLMAVRLGQSASRACRRVPRGVQLGTSAYDFAHVLVGQEPVLAMGQGLLPGRSRFGGVVGESCRGGAAALAFVEHARQEDFVHLVN